MSGDEMSDEIEAAIEELEDALSDLRWIARGGKLAGLAKVRTAIMRAEDHLDTITPRLLESS